MIQLLEETIEAARKSNTIYHMHLFHLALVLAHLICRSIRLTIVGPGHIGDWTWEVRYFGGYIERILSPNPYARVSDEQNGVLMKRVKLYH
jgi:hypothetical protein